MVNHIDNVCLNKFRDTHKMSQVDKNSVQATGLVLSNKPLDPLEAAKAIPTVTVTEEEIQPDNALAFAQSQRIMLAKSIAPGGVMPVKNTDRLAFLQSLNDLSTQALAEKRLDVDKDNGQVNQQVLAIVAQMAANNPAGMRVDTTTPLPSREPIDLPVVQVDDSVVSTVIVQENAADFMKRHKDATTTASE
jgi:hypothetical protein